MLEPSQALREAWALHGPKSPPSQPKTRLKSDDDVSLVGEQPVVMSDGRDARRLQQAVVPTAALPWPLPALARMGSQRVVISPEFRFECSSSCNAAACVSPIAAAAFSRYVTRLTRGIQPADADATAAQLSSVTVCVETASEELGQSTNESYQLRVHADRRASTLSARTIFGAMRGMESLTQRLSGMLNMGGV